MKLNVSDYVGKKIRVSAFVKTNDKVMFATDSVCMAGTFKGISKRGDLTFNAKVKDVEVTFNVKPSSIKALEIL